MAVYACLLGDQVPACLKCGNWISEKSLYAQCLRCGHPIGAPVEAATPALTVPSKADHSRRNAVLVVAGLLVAYLLVVPKGSSPPQTAAQATAVITRTATPVPTPSPTPDKSAAQYIDPRLLVADPKAYVGQNILLQGKALTVEQKAAESGGLFTTARSAHTWIQLLAQIRGKESFSTESIVIELSPQDRTFLKDECYRMYGVVRGTQTVRLLLTGAEREVPIIAGYAYERVGAGQFNVGCAAP